MAGETPQLPPARNIPGLGFPADPVTAVLTVDEAVVGENGKLVNKAYQHLIPHYANELPREKHIDSDRPGARSGEDSKFLRSWDDAKGAGWIASHPSSSSKVTSWFNKRVWGSWRLAYLLARLQRDVWANEGNGGREAPKKQESPPREVPKAKAKAKGRPRKSVIPPADLPAATAAAPSKGRTSTGSSSTASATSDDGLGAATAAAAAAVAAAVAASGDAEPAPPAAKRRAASVGGARLSPKAKAKAKAKDLKGRTATVAKARPGAGVGGGVGAGFLSKAGLPLRRLWGKQCTGNIRAPTTERTISPSETAARLLQRDSPVEEPVDLEAGPDGDSKKKNSSSASGSTVMNDGSDTEPEVEVGTGSQVSRNPLSSGAFFERIAKRARTSLSSTPPSAEKTVGAKTNDANSETPETINSDDEDEVIFETPPNSPAADCCVVDDDEEDNSHKAKDGGGAASASTRRASEQGGATTTAAARAATAAATATARRRGRKAATAAATGTGTAARTATARQTGVRRRGKRGRPTLLESFFGDPADYITSNKSSSSSSSNPTTAASSSTTAPSSSSTSSARASKKSAKSTKGKPLFGDSPETKDERVTLKSMTVSDLAAADPHVVSRYIRAQGWNTISLPAWEGKRWRSFAEQVEMGVIDQAYVVEQIGDKLRRQSYARSSAAAARAAAASSSTTAPASRSTRTSSTTTNNRRASSVPPFGAASSSSSATARGAAGPPTRGAAKRAASAPAAGSKDRPSEAPPRCTCNCVIHRESCPLYLRTCPKPNSYSAQQRKGKFTFGFGSGGKQEWLPPPPRTRRASAADLKIPSHLSAWAKSEVMKVQREVQALPANQRKSFFKRKMSVYHPDKRLVQGSPVAKYSEEQVTEVFMELRRRYDFLT